MSSPARVLELVHEQHALAGVAEDGLDRPAAGVEPPRARPLAGLRALAARLQRGVDAVGRRRVGSLLGLLAARPVTRGLGAGRDLGVTERLEREQHAVAVERLHRDGEAHAERALVRVAERGPREARLEVALQERGELAGLVRVLGLEVAGEDGAVLDRGHEQPPAADLGDPAVALLGGRDADLVEQRAELGTPRSQALGLALALFAEEGHSAANRTG